MIETKAHSQTYLANPYNTLGPLPFDADKYVITALNFLNFLVFFSLPVSCHLSNDHEQGVIQWAEATPLVLSGLDWIVRPLATIHQFSLSHALDRR